MIPGCHSVVASWDYVGVGCAYVVLASSWLWSLVFCWGASDSPLSAQQQARLVVASKAVGHQSWWLGVWLLHPLVSPCWRGGLTCLGLNL